MGKPCLCFDIMERSRVKELQSKKSLSCKSVFISALHFLKTVMKASFHCIRRKSIVFDSDHKEQEREHGNILQLGPVAISIQEAEDSVKDEEDLRSECDADVFESELELDFNEMKQNNSFNSSLRE